MTAWQTLTRALHAKGGGPLRRMQFDHEVRSDSAASHGIGKARDLGLVYSTGRYSAAVWTLTEFGRDWCAGFAFIPGAAVAESPAEKQRRIARLVSDSDEAFEACSRLTERQRAMLTMTAKGFTHAEIAWMFGITRGSAEEMSRRIVAAIGCGRTIEAAVIAAKAGLV